MLQRLASNWVYGGFLAGLLLLVLAPLVAGTWPPVLAAVYLHLPAYMIHQYEEHDDDRFRRFFNQTIGQGHEALSPLAVFVTNVPGVWGVIALALWLASRVRPGFALIATYLLLVNAAVHVMPALAQRRYNPGLVTAVVLFAPLTGWTLVAMQQSDGVTTGYHALGLGSAVLIHAAILLHVRVRVREFATRTTSV